MSKSARILTSDELTNLLNFISTRKNASRNRLIIMLMHFAGMAVNEVAILSINDVINNGTIKEIIISSSGRKIILNEQLRAEIVLYLKTIQSLNNTEPLFSTQRSAGFTANTLTQVVNGFYKAAGLEGATSNSGKRGFLTSLANKGIDEKILNKIAGHKTIYATRRYIKKTKTTDEDLINAVNLLDK